MISESVVLIQVKERFISACLWPKKKLNTIFYTNITILTIDHDVGRDTQMVQLKNLSISLQSGSTILTMVFLAPAACLATGTIATNVPSQKDLTKLRILRVPVSLTNATETKNPMVPP